MAKKATKKQHGGTRPGAGRPAKPPDEQRNNVVSAKFTTTEVSMIDAKANGNRNEWARRILLKAAGRSTPPPAVDRDFWDNDPS